MSRMCSSKSSSGGGAVAVRAMRRILPAPGRLGRAGASTARRARRALPRSPAGRPGGAHGADQSTSAGDDADADEAARRYPRHWEADVAAPRRAHRPPAPDPTPSDERAAGRVLRRGLATQSKYSGSSRRCPPCRERDVVRFTHVDHHERVGFVITLAAPDDRGGPLRRGQSRARRRSRSSSQDAAPGPRDRPAAARAPRPGRPRAWGRAVRRRGAAREPPDDSDLPRRRLPRGRRPRRRRHHRRVLHRPDRDRDRRDARPRAPRRVALDPAVLQRPQRRRRRGLAAAGDTIGQALVRNLVHGRLPGPRATS